MRQRATHAPRLVPAGETDDGPRQVSDFRPGPGYSCGHSAGFAPASFLAGGRDRRTSIRRSGLGGGARPCQEWPVSLSGARQIPAAGRKPAPFQGTYDEIRHPPRLSHDHRPDDRRHQLPDPLDLGQGRRHAAPRDRPDRPSGMDRRRARCSTPAARLRASTSASAASGSAKSERRTAVRRKAGSGHARNSAAGVRCRSWRPLRRSTRSG